MTKVLGRFTRDVHLQHVDINGDSRPVLNNSIAIRNSNGKNESTFLDITAWNGVAELLARNLVKGDEVLLTGEIRNKKQKINDKDYTFQYLLVEKVEFTSGSKQRKEQSEGHN